MADVSPNARQILCSELDTQSEASKYFSEQKFCFYDSDEEAGSADDVLKHYREHKVCWSDSDDEVEEANASDDYISRL